MYNIVPTKIVLYRYISKARKLLHPMVKVIKIIVETRDTKK